MERERAYDQFGRWCRVSTGRESTPATAASTQTARKTIRTRIAAMSSACLGSNYQRKCRYYYC